MARTILRKRVAEAANGSADQNAQPAGTAIYIRVSTQQQAETGNSLEYQQERLMMYCKAHDWNVTDEHVYVDEGISGKTTDRPAFMAMLAAAAKGEVNRIVALKLDRLARNTRNFLSLVDELTRLGCNLVLMAENFDTSTPNGKFALTLFAALAELEASTIKERMMSGKHQQAQNGEFNGGRIPFGYTYTDAREWVPNENAAVVRRIFREFNDDGAPLASIAMRLNADALTTARGKLWTHQAVKYILMNGFYAGLAQWNTVEVKGTHPPIVERNEYERAYARLSGLRSGPPIGRAAHNTQPCRLMIDMPQTDVI